MNDMTASHSFSLCVSFGLELLPFSSWTALAPCMFKFLQYRDQHLGDALSKVASTIFFPH